MRIAVLEDEPEHAAQLTRVLDEVGYAYQCYGTGKALLLGLVRETFDVLVLDWMLPDADGIAVLDQLRSRSISTPVMFTTSRDAEADIVEALTHGADDYLVKPIRPNEFLARLQVLTRRSSLATMDTLLEVSPYRFDLATGKAWVGQEAVTLTTRQFALAVFFFRNPGKLLSRTHLLETIWGVGAEIQTRTLEIHVSQLRKLLGLMPENGWRITSVYGHGYRLESLA